MWRMTLQFEVGRLAVVVVDQRFAVVAKGHGTQIGHQQQPVAGKIEITVNRLAHHAAHIRATGIVPTLVHLAGDGGPSDVVVLLDHDHIQPGPGQRSRPS